MIMRKYLVDLLTEIIVNFPSSYSASPLFHVPFVVDYLEKRPMNTANQIDFPTLQIRKVNYLLGMKLAIGLNSQKGVSSYS